MPKKPDHYYQQSGVIPFRLIDGNVEILLITSRKRKNWIIPKGIIEPHLSPAESAAQEAFEEAGVKGVVYTTLLGKYQHHKWKGICDIQVYAMKIQKTLEDWPESQLRERKWFSQATAADKVNNQALADIIRHMDIS